MQIKTCTWKLLRVSKISICRWTRKSRYEIFQRLHICGSKSDFETTKNCFELLNFRRQMHDLVLLFKYKTGTVTSNFGRFIHTTTRHYRTRNFHQANFDLLSRHNQEYYCNSYFPRTVKLWNSLPNILKSSQDLLWFRVHLYEHFRGVLQTYSPPWFVNFFFFF